MVGLTVTMTGLKEIKLKKEDMTFAIHAAGDMALELAERYCPQDTGELYDSIFLNKDDYSFELGATSNHAWFNEYGCYNIEVGDATSPKAGKYSGQRPFIRPAVIAAQLVFPQVFGQKNYGVEMITD